MLRPFVELRARPDDFVAVRHFVLLIIHLCWPDLVDDSSF